MFASVVASVGVAAAAPTVGLVPAARAAGLSPANAAVLLASADLLVLVVVGLLAGAHCLGMCGPVVLLYADRLSGRAEADGAGSTGSPPRADGGAGVAAGDDPLAGAEAATESDPDSDPDTDAGRNDAGTDDRAILERAAALDRYATHPIADAIVADAPSVPEAGDVEVLRRGVAGTVAGSPTLVGHPDLFRERGWELPGTTERAADAIQDRGAVPVVVGWGGTAVGAIGVGDTPRSDWEAVLEAIGADRDLVVLTGDDRRAAERFRDHPAVDEVFAGVPPDGKAAAIEGLRHRGTVAMVGDGSNDAPALAAADLGIAVGGTALATDAADVAIVEGGLGAVPDALSLLAATRRRIRQNLGWALCYNAVAIPAAAIGALNPLVAAVAMAASSALVVANSTRSLLGDGE